MEAKLNCISGKSFSLYAIHHHRIIIMIIIHETETGIILVHGLCSDEMRVFMVCRVFGTFCEIVCLVWLAQCVTPW